MYLFLKEILLSIYIIMERKFFNININNLKKRLNILLKNPNKNFDEINSIYQTLLINYFYLKKNEKLDINL